MKPSDFIQPYTPTDNQILDILDAMAEDIVRLKFLVQYVCSSDLLKVYPIKEREWEKCLYLNG